MSISEMMPAAKPQATLQVEARQLYERRIAAVALSLATVISGNVYALTTTAEARTLPTAATPDSQIEDSATAQRITAAISDSISSAGQIQSKPRPLPDPEIDSQPEDLRPAVVSPPTLPPAIPETPLLTMSQEPPATAKLNLETKPSEFTPMSQLTRERLDAVNLTAEAYQLFSKNIDTSHFAFAQGFVPFNPEKVAIRQQPTEFFTLHFTTFFSNTDPTIRDRPDGPMDVRRLVQSMGERHPVCCGVNWILGRDGTVYQTAPVSAKLRHNPPYDPITTGVEVEAVNQDGISPAQYEALAYLTIAVLKHQGLLDKELADSVHGHGEDRDTYRQRNPDSKWASRNDFDKETTDHFRSKLQGFLDAYPDIRNIEFDAV